MAHSPSQSDTADTRFRRWVMGTVCFFAAAMAGAYLWAVPFGDALAGLKLGASVNNADSYPSANLIFVAAMGIYLVSPWAAWWWSGFPRGRSPALTWYVSTASAGAVLFGLSRLIL
jgi:hypothetical protein